MTAAKTPMPVKPPAAARPANRSGLGSFLSVDPVRADLLPDEVLAAQQYQRQLKLVRLNAYIILLLGAVLVFGVPFFEPVYQYFAMNPQHQVLPIVALNMPNMTNRALLSWATNSTTEIMTMGFGDYEKHLLEQRYRFTEDGWESFAKAFDRQRIGELFRQRQLVLTTVPSNTPVIIAQGINDKHVYQWRVQLPVVLTYATNNQVTKGEKAIIELTIVRVPPETYPAGIAIKNWNKTI